MRRASPGRLLRRARWRRWPALALTLRRAAPQTGRRCSARSVASVWARGERPLGVVPVLAGQLGRGGWLPQQTRHPQAAHTQRSAGPGMYGDAEPLISAELRSALKAANKHAGQRISMRVGNALNSARAEDLDGPHVSGEPAVPVPTGLVAAQNARIWM